MMAAGSFYPYSCNPNDVMEARISNNKNYIFPDVQLNGCYSGFARNYFAKLGITLDEQPGDDELLAQNTCDFLGFSYYSSRLISTDPEHLKMWRMATPLLPCATRICRSRNGDVRSTRLACA